ncbi:hypothetical protein POTOM_031695 [Populus tomentosa]|uniref:Acyl-[acyl-carrier-protein] hydrolase n=1 Tax=Populus tomentosa TaxID=118781 RepID=A0A8X7Z6V9_POPTO|nr:hypothetical protein POTOM_031695 [Populus tomentosa]
MIYLAKLLGWQKTFVASVQNGHISKEHIRQNIPIKKQLVDYHRQGLIIEEGVEYRQTVVIRSYEVGSDKTATLESIRNLLQGRAYGNRHKGRSAREKNGMRRDWLIRSQSTGHVFARATSTWVMMNQKTRRLSKMPEEVMAEISPWFTEKQAIQEDVPEKISKLDSKAKYVNSNLKRSDLNMNQHVNNVKYVRWMLETIPDLFLESHQLSSIILEYRRECGGSNIVQSLCEPDEDGILNSGLKQNNDISPLNRFSLALEIMESNGQLGSLDNVPLRYTHLLQTQGETKNEEIVRVKDHMEEKAI